VQNKDEYQELPLRRSHDPLEDLTNLQIYSNNSTRGIASRPWIIALIVLAFVAIGWCGFELVFPLFTGENTSARSEQSVKSRNNPFEGEKFYVDPDSAAKRQAAAWRATRPKDAAQIDKIASQPETYFFSEWTAHKPGGTVGQVDQRVTEITRAGALPVLGAYAIPNRDCGKYSKGGFTKAEQYRGWIRDFAKGIGDRKAIVVLEPDALASDYCLSEAQRQQRYAIIKDAVEVLKAQPDVWVYIDAGNPGWRTTNDMANSLKKSGIDEADGFSLNVSNFVYTSDNFIYGTRLSFLVGGKHFIIDTSRNGLGPAPDGSWCNPPGRALGPKPTADTGFPPVDAFYWIKSPGHSDGECGNSPSAGTWMPKYALGLARRAAY
jgi:endoglucanase